VLHLGSFSNTAGQRVECGDRDLGRRDGQRPAVRVGVKVLDEIRQAQLDAAAQPGGVAVDGEQTCGEQPVRVPRVDDRSTAAPSRSTPPGPTRRARSLR